MNNQVINQEDSKKELIYSDRIVNQNILTIDYMRKTDLPYSELEEVIARLEEKYQIVLRTVIDY